LPEIRLGASPRATLQLIRTSRARAALAGRDFVVPDDVQEMAQPVLCHRLVLSAQAVLDRRSPEEIVGEVLARVPIPQAPRQPPVTTERRDRNGALGWPRSPQRR
jgi:MoxR-like ATPase